MLSRRQFLTRTLQGSSLVALTAAVPQFIARTARAAPVGKDNILVVLEMNGGNDGLKSGMQAFKPLSDQGQLAVVQGVGYPNPERSHFEAMDILQSADVKRM